MKRPVIFIAALGMILASHVGPLRADDLADCNSGEPDRVIGGCTQLLEEGRLNLPYQANAYNNRGIAFQSKSDLDRALADFDRAIAINPKHDRAYGNRASVYILKRQYSRAIADIDTAITLSPQLWQAYVVRGTAHHGMGQYGRAIADYTMALDLSPNQPAVLNNRAYAHSLNGNPERALADIEAALARDPENARIHHSLGEIYFYAGQPDNAMEAWKATCRLASDEVTRMWQRNLAERGHYAGAIDGTCDSRLIEAFRSCAREKCFE